MTRVALLFLHFAGPTALLEEVQGVVQHARIAGPDLDGGHIFVLGQPGRQHHDAEQVPAAGADGDLLRHRQHQVGFAHLPAVHELTRRRRVLDVPLRRVGVDPLGQRGPLLVAQLALVVERGARHRLPRRHPAVLGVILDVLGPVDGLGIGLQGERPHFALAMALLAVCLQDRQHVAVIGDPPVLDRLLLADDGAADGPRGRDADVLAGQDVFEGLLQVVVRGLGILLEPGGVAVVDPAAITQDEARIQHERLGRGFRLESLGRDALGILEHRERQAILRRLLGQLGRRQGIAGMDTQELDTLGTVSLVQFGQGGRVGGADRTIEGQEDNDDGFLVLDVVQGNGLAFGVGEGETLDLLVQLIEAYLVTGPGRIVSRPDSLQELVRLGQNLVLVFHLVPSVDGGSDFGGQRNQRDKRQDG